MFQFQKERGTERVREEEWKRCRQKEKYVFSFLKNENEIWKMEKLGNIFVTYNSMWF